MVCLPFAAAFITTLSFPHRNLTDDDLAVFQTLFDGIFYQVRTRIVIVNKNRLSTPHNPLMMTRLRLMKSKPPVPTEMMNAHTERNKKAVSLTEFHPRQWHVYKDLETVEKILGGKEQNWERFYKTFPNTRGYVRLMLPVYNSNHTMALTFFESYAGAKSGFGAVYQLTKVGGKWKVANSLGGWVE